MTKNKKTSKTGYGAEPRTRAKQQYGAQQITVLEGLEPVRKRPGMYIGGTGAEGLHHLVWEVVDNSIDEAMAGFCTRIEVYLLPDGVVKVTDNGRGIPVDPHPQYKVSALELVLTKLHAGGKFGAGGYKVSGGLHGVGVSVVNALSESLRAEVKRGGSLWVQEYVRGKPKSKVKTEGKAAGTGTTITFKPDAQIFKDIKYDWETLLVHFRQQAYLTKGVTICVYDERETRNSKLETGKTDQISSFPAQGGSASGGQFPVSYCFYFEGGIASYVRYLNFSKEPKHDNIFYVDKTAGAIQTEVALQYTDDLKETVLTFANNIVNPGGGTHLIGFKSALTRVLNNYARSRVFLKEKDDNLSGEDVREGLTAIISVKVPEPQFEGQTKDKLGNPEVRTAVEEIFGDSFASWLEEHPRDAEAILNKCILASRARAAAKAARDAVIRKGALEGLALPGKLADCSSKDPKESELFIVEGDSAGGCFSGDTKIALTDGRAVSFFDLEKEQAQGITNYCYTMKNDGHIAIAPIANVRRTKQNASVVKVILDSGEEIVCTPDHKFRLVDGSYIAARSLTPEMSIAPLRRQLSRLGKRITIKGYELVYDAADRRWIFTHLLSDQYNLQRGKYLASSGSHRQKQAARVRQYFVSHPELLKTYEQNAKQQWQDKALLQWRAKKTKEQWTPEFRATRRKTYDQTYYRKTIAMAKGVLEKFGSLERFDKERIGSKDRSILSLQTFTQRFFKNNRDNMEEAVRNYNHKIRAIVPISEKIDVYDLEVPHTHNFALAAGVFVHNSAKQGRNRETQAILPLRGKILNVERARLDKMLSNNEIKSLIIALGTGIGEQIDLSKLRYWRVCIMTDADVDGAHIRTLLLTMFYRYFPELITGGHLYIAQPPLYRIQSGKDLHYAYSDAEKEKVLNEIESASGKKVKDRKAPKAAKAPAAPEDTAVALDAAADATGAMGASGAISVNLQRYKGLGEMNPDQLWETTMDPKQRLLKQVTIEDVQKADQIFDILMGAEVEPRKRFIQTHAKAVKNLDI